VRFWPGRSGAVLKLGTYGFPLLRRTLSLPLDQARAHMHVMGITGSGKSRFLAGLFLSLLDAGLSATLVDPHGGEEDIRERRIDVLRPAAFEEDPLRMLRACQFAARFEYAVTPGSADETTISRGSPRSRLM